MQLTRITATLGAVALGGVLVASTTTAGASAPTHQPQPAHQRSVVPDRFVPPTPPQAPSAQQPQDGAPLRLDRHVDLAPTQQMGTPEQLVVVVLAVLVVGGLLMVALLWTTLRTMTTLPGGDSHPFSE